MDSLTIEAQYKDFEQYGCAYLTMTKNHPFISNLGAGHVALIGSPKLDLTQGCVCVCVES